MDSRKASSSPAPSSSSTPSPTPSPPHSSPPSTPTPRSRRYNYVLPMGCALIALILGLILFCSGVKDDSMAKHDIVTLKTDKIRVGDITGHSAGLSGFYSIHVFGFCQGSLRNGIDKDIERCSKPRGLFAFNIRESLQHDAKQSNHPLAELNWPTAIDVIFESFALRFKIMMVLYTIALFATLVTLSCGGMEMIHWMNTMPDEIKERETKCWRELSQNDASSMMQILERVRAYATRMKKWRIDTYKQHLTVLRMLAHACSCSSALACAALMIASTIVTDSSFTTAAVVNKYGRNINISATAGLSFMIMSWAATVFMLLAPMAWMSTPMRSWLSNELKRVETGVKADESHLEEVNNAFADIQAQQGAGQ